MDYQQSIKNLYHLKNFVRAWTECNIFFFFNSETEYKIEIFELNFTTDQRDAIDQNLRSGFPYGYICNKKIGEETLYYSDANIDVDFDFFLNEWNDFICYDPVDMKLVQMQFALLFDLLKK